MGGMKLIYGDWAIKQLARQGERRQTPNKRIQGRSLVPSFDAPDHGSSTFLKDIWLLTREGQTGWK